jgi:hypothetical protein
MILVQRRCSNPAAVNKEMAMEKSTDPPSDERKHTEFWKRVRKLFRVLVNRQTLMTAFTIVLWTTRIVRLLRQTIGGF